MADDFVFIFFQPGKLCSGSGYVPPKKIRWQPGSLQVNDRLPCRLKSFMKYIKNFIRIFTLIGDFYAFLTISWRTRAN